MTNRENWQAAFLIQAKADWEAYLRTCHSIWPVCYRLHFLQMTSEKLGKAFLIASHSSLETITHSHAAFVKFVRIIGNNRKLRKALEMNKFQQRAHVKALLPLALEIELLAPALARNGSNPEYPWEDASGKVLPPVDQSFPLVKRLHQTPQGIQLLKLIAVLIERFEEFIS